jgi:hypothetical protein
MRDNEVVLIIGSASMNFTKLVVVTAISMNVLSYAQNANAAAVIIATIASMNASRTNHKNATQEVTPENIAKSKGGDMHPKQMSVVDKDEQWGLWLEERALVPESTHGKDALRSKDLSISARFSTLSECLQMYKDVTKWSKMSGRNQCLPGKYLGTAELEKRSDSLMNSWGLWMRGEYKSKIEIKEYFRSQDDCMSVANPLFELSQKTAHIQCLPGKYRK